MKSLHFLQLKQKISPLTSRSDTQSCSKGSTLSVLMKGNLKLTKNKENSMIKKFISNHSIHKQYIKQFLKNKHHSIFPINAIQSNASLYIQRIVFLYTSWVSLAFKIEDNFLAANG